jgi:hypothetical protein
MTPTVINSPTVAGVPVETWQAKKVAEAFALYHVRRIQQVWTERAAAFALEARLVAITAMADAAEGGLR